MAALTGGRLSNVSLDPLLQTRGIELGGAQRLHEALSVGTQEQLATLLRLSIAEALGSFLVLDDQLTQSDPARMDWFRDVLRGCAEEIQVVVFTCRPEDYLTAEEAARAPLDGVVRSVDLAAVVERNFVGSDGGRRKSGVRRPAIGSGVDTAEGREEERTPVAVPPAELSVGRDQPEGNVGADQPRSAGEREPERSVAADEPERSPSEDGSVGRRSRPASEAVDLMEALRKSLKGED